MKTFQEFVAAQENSMRTALGIMPPQAGAGLYPPLYFAPIAADHAVKLKNNHDCKCTGKGKCQCDAKKKKKSKKK